MKKLLAIFAAIMLIAQPSFAAVGQLTDAQLDGVAAGDWVVTTTSEEVVDVYSTNNNLDLQDDSQTYLQAVSNATAVDSAVNVATNIASVTGAEPSTNQSVNGYNEADIANYKPAESGESASGSAFSWASSKSESSSFGLNASESKDFKWGSSFGYSETLDENTTLDIAYASASAFEADCSKDCSGEGVSAEAVVSDYDKVVDYDKIKVSGSSKTIHEDETVTISASESSSESSRGYAKEYRSSSYRNNRGMNNHLKSEDNSQQFLQAVSNLNAVASGAAAQSNIASNVGVSGTISHSNIATVASGL